MHDTEPGAGFGGQDITYDNGVTYPEGTTQRRPRRWPWLFAAATVVAAGGIIVGVGKTSGPPPVSSACQQAVAAQNAYVDRAVALGYPNMDVYDGLTVITVDEALLNNLAKAHCPGSTVIHTLPDGG